MKSVESNVARSAVVCWAFALLGAFSTAQPAFAAAAGTQGGSQYGYCSARTADDKKVFVSVVFEMSVPDIQEHNQVMYTEFTKMLNQKYGAPAGANEALTGGCTVVWYVSKAAAEEKRQIVIKYAGHAQLFDTGWTFVRTAQTPPPGPPVGGH
jgi:hypothetical protein